TNLRTWVLGPPGTGKTLLARASAARTKSTFLKLAGPQLIQMFIGDGAKLVRDAFAIAKEKAQQSLMNWMSLAPIVLTPRKLETPQL
ncbi:unnamed protein product, partial [Diamesa serratosioi]